MQKGAQMLWAAGGYITLTLNEAELSAIYHAAIDHTHVQPLPMKFSELIEQSLEASIAALAEQAVQLVDYFRIILTTCGENECLLVLKLSDKDVSNLDDEAKQYGFVLGDRFHLVCIRHFPPPEELAGGKVVSINGAGNSLVGTVIAGGLEELRTPPHTRNRLLNADRILGAKEAAAMTMRSS